MIGEQADLHRALVQERRREALDAFAHHRARDRQRVDLIGLAGLALALARLAHQLRRDPHDALARGDQRQLEPARDMPAVLDRPHALLVEFARPAQRLQMPRLVRAESSAAPRSTPLPASTAANACVRLWVSAPSTIIDHRPS